MRVVYRESGEYMQARYEYEIDTSGYIHRNLERHPDFPRRRRKQRFHL
jgi:hypothetical protein